MPAAAAGGGGGWVVANRSGKKAIIFKPNKHSHGIDPPGQGIKHFRFRAGEPGMYRLAMRLNAPHTTEYNEYVFFWNDEEGGGMGELGSVPRGDGRACLRVICDGPLRYLCR